MTDLIAVAAAIVVVAADIPSTLCIESFFLVFCRFGRRLIKVITSI